MLGYANDFLFLLQSPNVLITEDYRAKVADLGLSRTLASSMSRKVGTTRWTAPEVLSGKRYSTKADVYSYGMLCWEVATNGELPFGKRVFSHEIEDSVIGGTRPDIPVEAPHLLAALISQCWHSEPIVRPDLRDIVGRLIAIGQMPNDEPRTEQSDDDNDDDDDDRAIR
jgi:serine/threonine protein kinase